MKRLMLWGCLLLWGIVGFAKIETLDGVAAIVNDEVITQSDLMRQYNMIQHQLKEADQPIPAKDKLTKQVLQHMVDVELQLQEAKAYGINVTDADVTKAIENIARENKISMAELRLHVKEQGYSYDQYRKNIKQQIILSEVQKQLVGNRIHISPDTLEREYQHAIEKNSNQNEYHIKNILVPLSDAPTSKEYAQAKLKAQTLYKKIKGGQSFDALAVSESSDFSALEGGDLGWRTTSAMPNVFVKHVQKLKVGEVTTPIATPNGFHLVKLLDKRSAIKPHYVSLSHVRHILIRVPDSHFIRDSRTRIDGIRKMIVSGKDFAEVAKTYSDDIASAQHGGDLGWVKPGELVPEFEQVASKLKVNELSPPVKTPFGWHLIQVLGRKTQDDSKEQYKLKIADQLYQREFESKINDWLQRLRGKSYITVKQIG